MNHDKSYIYNGFYFEFFTKIEVNNFTIKTLNFYRKDDNLRYQLKNFHYELYIENYLKLKFGCWVKESQIPEETITYLFDEEFELISIELVDIFDRVNEIKNIVILEDSFSFETHKFNSFLIDESSHCMQNLILNEFKCDSINSNRIIFGYNVKYKSGEIREVYCKIDGLEIIYPSFVNINFLKLNPNIISLTGFVKINNYSVWDYDDFLDIIGINETMCFEFKISDISKVSYKIDREPLKMMNNTKLKFVEFKRDKIGWTCNFIEEYE